MKLRYRVHSANPSPLPVTATLENGETVEATTLALEVELVPEGHRGGTLTLRLLGADKEARAADLASYQVGALVEIDPILVEE